MAIEYIENDDSVENQKLIEKEKYLMFQDLENIVDHENFEKILEIYRKGFQKKKKEEFLENFEEYVNFEYLKDTVLITLELNHFRQQEELQKEK
jgi:predicted NAD-dependent protein-ADP-ribosyltransferase YbiA (DUF1768 family)